VVVLSTVGTAEDAERIARALVEGGLAACVNVVPAVTSIYRWKGKLEREEERLLVIKTRAERFEALREALVALHPYDVPEVLALPVSAGHEPYLEWLDGNVGFVKPRPARDQGRRSGPPRPRSPR
jgi:periplasmic divalent cation tolerance protein